MKTKYVKVQVSERLPEKSGFYVMFVKNNPIPVTKYFAILGFNNNLEYWLEPAPDHSEEMLSLLEGIVDAQYNPETTLSEMNIRVRKAKEFLNKVKVNGK
ncbi:hypothetical protein HZP39_04230 [Elizabethkingia anophelis]|nr:hypothetical protein [Elizabethkingia anophelis]MCT4239432.1 hypothetical protein [Elizabethkingia anophelis]MCT4281997.1 hypothetical protein [Elizabethkingia anophelis]MCT4292582.1 hypothetical protein [Elizabethkingia anophelis]